MSFSGPILGQRVTGVVRDFWRDHGVRYVRLYSYAAREERTYRLEGNGIAKQATVRATEADSDPPELTSIREEPSESPTSVRKWPFEPGSSDVEGGSGPARSRRRGELWWLVASVVLAALLVPVAGAGIAKLRTAGMSYGEFLSSDMSVSTLVRTVSARVSYKRDVEEYWSAPEAVWQEGIGDCEDYAMLVSAYLARHGIEHRVYAFSLKDSLQGHAAVIADTESGHVLIDPTNATAPTGLKAFSAKPNGTAPGPREILDPYAVFPVRVYDSPPEPGRPQPARLIE